MGKLHTLRRAIERDPEKWVKRAMNGRIYAVRGARGYAIRKGVYEPSDWLHDYKAFVVRTLKDMDYLRPGDSV